MPTSQSASLWSNIGSVSAGPTVPYDQRDQKRFLFVFLIDTSSSTTIGGANADIHHINQQLGAFMDAIRNPHASDPLFPVRDQIDISILTYNSKVTEICAWESAANIPTTFDFKGGGFTHTKDAFNQSIKMIQDRLELFKQPGHKISTGTPHIFHFTDGVPNDVTIGTPEWTEFLQTIEKFTGDPSAEQRQKGNIVHFVSPRGCVIEGYNYQTDTDGTKLSGEDILKKLAGPVPVVKLTRGPESLKAALRLVTMIVTSVSALGARKSTAEIVSDAVRANAGTLDSSPGVPLTGLPPGTRA